MVGGRRRSKQGIHSPPSLLAPDLQGAGELGDGGCSAPGSEEALGSLQMLAVVERQALRLSFRLLATHQS